MESPKVTKHFCVCLKSLNLSFTGYFFFRFFTLLRPKIRKSTIHLRTTLVGLEMKLKYSMLSNLLQSIQSSLQDHHLQIQPKRSLLRGTKQSKKLSAMFRIPETWCRGVENCTTTTPSYLKLLSSLFPSPSQRE